MKMSKIKLNLKSFIYRHRILYCFYKFISSFTLNGLLIFNDGRARILSHIQGENNKIDVCNGAVLNDVSVWINGNNNTIKFEQNVIIGDDCSFLIEGNNIKIIIGKGCTFTKKISFCAQEDNTSIIDNLKSKISKLYILN